MQSDWFAWLSRLSFRKAAPLFGGVSFCITCILFSLGDPPLPGFRGASLPDDRRRTPEYWIVLPAAAGHKISWATQDSLRL